IAGAGVVLPAVAMRYLDLPEVFKILTGARGEFSVDLDANYMTGISYDLSHDCCVVTDAAPHVQNAISLTKLEGIDTEGKVARLPVVQMASRVNRDEYVVVQVSRISVLCSSIVFTPITHNPPWPGPKKMLARNLRERIYQCRRSNVCHGSDFLCKVSPNITKVHTILPLWRGRFVESGVIQRDVEFYLVELVSPREVRTRAANGER